MLCLICLKEVHNKYNPKGTICSLKCQQKWINKIRLSKTIVKFCLTCKKKIGRFFPNSHRIRKYCSNQCSAKARWGAGNPMWKGGRKKHSGGYIYIYKPDHPYVGKNGYVLEHRLVIEGILGRYLKPMEIVHHLNGKKDDNNPSNLELISSQSNHLKNKHVHQDGWFGRKNKKGPL